MCFPLAGRRREKRAASFCICVPVVLCLVRRRPFFLVVLGLALCARVAFCWSLFMLFPISLSPGTLGSTLRARLANGRRKYFLFYCPLFAFFGLAARKGSARIHSCGRTPTPPRTRILFLSFFPLLSRLAGACPTKWLSLFLRSKKKEKIQKEPRIFLELAGKKTAPKGRNEKNCLVRRALCLGQCSLATKTPLQTTQS